jgi:uncharacterized protein YhaN
MATEYLSEVRDELNSRSTRTTLDELKSKGLEQVRVIRSSQILQLIERAVDGALKRRGQKLGAHDREGVVADSSKMFKEMMDAQAQLAAMQQEVAARDAALNEAQAKQAELDAELRVMKSRKEGAAPQDLLDELRSLRQEIQSRPSAPAAAASAGPGGEVSGAIAEKLASLGAELSSQIDRIGRKVGVQSSEDEAPTAELANMFATSIPEVESNMDSVEAEERKGSDVSDALARMKSLRKGQGGT